MTRTPFDGQAFYCVWCGSEWAANDECASGYCELESDSEAEERGWLHAAEISVLQPITVKVARLSAPEFAGDKVDANGGVAP